MTNEQADRYFRLVHSTAKLEIDISRTERKSAKSIGWKDTEEYHTRRIAEIECIMSAFEMGAITAHESMRMILDAGIGRNNQSRLSEARAEESKKPEVFYTGGGIWISAINIDPTHYYTIDTESIDSESDDGWMFVYDRGGEDEDKFGDEFPCQNMVREIHVSSMNDTERHYYDMLREALKKEAY